MRIADGEAAKVRSTIERSTNPGAPFAVPGNLRTAVGATVSGAGVTRLSSVIASTRVSIKIPPGTASGKRFRVPNEGIEKDGQRGDLIVRVDVSVPEALTEEQQKAMKEFAEASKKIQGLSGAKYQKDGGAKVPLKVRWRMSRGYALKLGKASVLALAAVYRIVKRTPGRSVHARTEAWRTESRSKAISL